MKMSKCQYRIGDLAKQLNVEKFVIRFWEKELNIKPKRSNGGQRFYQEKDFNTFKKVKELLYEKKFTIAGAKAELKRKKENNNIVTATEKIIYKFDQSKLFTIKEKLEKLEKRLR